MCTLYTPAQTRSRGQISSIPGRCDGLFPEKAPARQALDVFMNVTVKYPRGTRSHAHFMMTLLFYHENITGTNGNIASYDINTKYI